MKFIAILIWLQNISKGWQKKFTVHIGGWAIKVLGCEVTGDSSALTHLSGQEEPEVTNHLFGNLSSC